MLKEADLLLEFWDKAAEYNVYMCNRIDTGLVINRSIISLQEVFTSKTPLVNYIKV